MKAGRELDALVAEKVMGFCSCLNSEHYLDSSWSVPVPSSWVGYAEGRRTTSSVYVVDSVNDLWHCTEHDLPLPPGKADYSTSIAAAWEVVEKFHPEWFVDIMTPIIESEPWLCYIHKPTEEASEVYSAFADTAPLAICLAALKAVE